MGANSSPPASEAALALGQSKKRKTSDAPLPLALAPADAASPVDADSLHTEATLERMATALDLSHSLVNRALLDPTLPKSTSLAMEDSRSRLEQLSSFVDALRAADVEGVAAQLARMFVSDVGVLSTLRDAAARAVDDAHKANNTIDITRTRRISSAASAPTPTSASASTPTPTPTPTTEPSASSTAASADANANIQPPNANIQPSNVGANVGAADAHGDVEMEVHEELHEEEAAQALTGLRLSSTASSAVAASAVAAVAAVAAAGVPLPSPRAVSSGGLPPMALPPAPTPTSGARDRSAIPSSVPYTPTPLPSLSPTHALSIFAPQAPPDLAAYAASGPAGLFVTAPHPHSHAHAHGLVHSPLGTPGSLPSIFARGLLAPIATPYDPSKNDFLGFVTSPMVTGTTPLGTPMLTPHGQNLGPFVDWKSLAPPSLSNTPSAAPATVVTAPPVTVEAPPVAPVPTADPAQQQGQQPTLTPVTNLYRPSPRSSGQASPVKRKSITSKQLVEAAVNHGANLALPIAKSLAALERTHPARKANPRRWTKEEDDALRQAVENHKEKNWKAIAAQVPGRNHTQCLQRWTKVLAPGLVKGHWSPHEDELLKRLVAGGNKNWGEVAAKIPGRTSKQCRERWHNHLDPNIVRGAYTPEEDRIILEAQARLGNRWSVIAAMLPGRTEDAVKIRWKSHCRLWKARKYLRKAGGEAGGDDDDLGPDPELNADESSDDDGGDEDEEQQQEAASKPAPVAA